MSKREDYEKKAENLAIPVISEGNFELVDVEYVKEAGEWYLRYYVDKEGGIGVNDCEAISRKLSDLLDEANFIDDAYILEVSSPGLLRPLKKEKDYVRNLGKPIEIRTFKAVGNSKEFIGNLEAFDADTVTIVSDNENKLTIEKKNISMIRQYVEF